MMVVVGIIVLLVSITVPAIGPMLASNKEAQVLNTLGGLLINAQATASQTTTSVGLRIERAFKVNDLGLMVDANGRTRLLDAAYDTVHPVVWLDHQQVRFVTLAAYKDQIFSQTKDTKAFDLPSSVWLAPDYALVTNWPTAAGLTDANLAYTPSYQAVPYAAFNRLETFYIVFNPAGDLIYYPAGRIIYADKTQQYQYVDSDGKTQIASPHILHPDSSARSVFLYDRSQWNDIPTTDSPARMSFLSRSRSVNINRITGSIVEAGTQ